MTLPEVQLDDVRFQQLVNECRRRLASQCEEWTEVSAGQRSEWTEVNLSDPGMTLVELFAWMTDMLCYRINRLPEKLHVALLSLLDVHLQPARAAAGELRFSLERPPASAVHIRARKQVATRRTSTQESIVFETTQGFTIAPIELQALLLGRAGVADRTPSQALGALDRAHRSDDELIESLHLINLPIRAGVALPAGGDRLAFGEPPRPKDCMLLGFRTPLDRLVVRVDVECARAHGAGVDPRHAPLEWYAVDHTESWAQAEVLGDSTDGFNRGGGSIELQLPERTSLKTIGGKRLYWLCCSVVESDRWRYKSPPEIDSLRAAPVGASVPAEHSQLVEYESLGTSDGTPGQSFTLAHTPILPAGESERLEVRDPNGGRWVAWTRVATFADSKERDPHYVLDETAGEIELGPAIREPRGDFNSHGATPVQGSELRFRAYRHGGGSRGNVAANTLTHLREPISEVSSVTNPEPTSGGADGESLAAARERTPIELRTRERAVTREDFERLSLAADQRVARARCVPGAAQEATRVHILPLIGGPPRRLTLRELTPDRQLLGAVARHLEERRLVGTSIAVAPAAYRAVRAVVYVAAGPATDPEDLRRRILYALYAHLRPVAGEHASDGPAGDPSALPAGGFEFGRPLHQGELHPIVRAVQGVREIKLLLLFEERLADGAVVAGPLEGDITLKPHELIASGRHRVRVRVDTDVAVDTDVEVDANADTVEIAGESDPDPPDADGARDDDDDDRTGPR